MQSLERALKMKDIKKGKYFCERHVMPKTGPSITKENQKTIVFIAGQCVGCGSQLYGDIDLSQEAKEMPCSNNECNYKYIYKDNTLYAT